MHLITKTYKNKREATAQRGEVTDDESSLSKLPVLFVVSQSDQLDGFCGKQKENVPPFSLDMVSTVHATPV